MQRPKFSLTPKNDVPSASTPPSYNRSSTSDPICISSSDDESGLSNEDMSKQLVLYDPIANGNNTIQLFPGSLQCESRTPPRRKSSRVLPSVGAYTVQCASCFKWRLIPTKEIYEAIRECIIEQPFVCQKAREWRPDVSCDDPEDISQDGGRLWAIDKPNIAKPPDGWERLTRIRSEGSSKFADIYYVAPTGKRLRSIVEIDKFLKDHPEYNGLDRKQFSFQVPKPLQEDYVRKRSAKTTSPTPSESSGSVENEQVRPLAWVGPEGRAQLHVRRLELPAPPCTGSSVSGSVSHPARKQATQTDRSKEVHKGPEGRAQSHERRLELPAPPCTGSSVTGSVSNPARKQATQTDHSEEVHKGPESRAQSHEQRLELPAPPCTGSFFSGSVSHPARKQATQSDCSEEVHESKNVISSHVETGEP